MTSQSKSEPRAKGRPSLEEAAAIDRAILDAAIAELIERGEAASLNAVAQAAGLSRKTVYARYSSKNHLFGEAVREVLRGAAPIRFDRTGTLEDRIAKYVVAVLDLLERPAARAFQKALSMHPDALAELRGELTQASQSMFLEPARILLQEAQQIGEIAEDADCNQAAQFVVSIVVFNHQFQVVPEGARESALSFASGIARLIVRGLAPR
ncbi:TetR/AcrR family transcriptional regulator [Novosphingobium aerophilum]|uniref:TetR/AcrR family transcriptional regulator n=1 Tax=Novosphingobium TaxID=165696 RepID=UPI0006C873F1|nr:MULTISPECIES: TetR/AcrR family transcriptional regulator [unclassified Novosphingobium]KPH66781.1 hypothetical protein ADT71_04515 [Novosphingobium sp. ST904]MPS68171.1 TetR/AcrR family transcriptional regulator [Novosphingobium sp.]TCM25806.1 TetR family transcriptional regulator [Novosphingobium sp. ST904]WRT95255.1 helix-turn-helix domain-containing protein [Novosphingobium sp. RL4]